MLRKIRLFLAFVIAQGFWLCSASATTVLFYNVAGDVLAVDFYASPGTLKPYVSFSGPGEVTREITLNGEVLKPAYLSPQNEPGASLYFFNSPSSASVRQAWHDGTIQNPGQFYYFSLDAFGPLYDGDKSLEEYRGLATGTATGIGAIYSIGQYPVPIPGTSVLLGLGLVGLCAARRKQA